MFVDVHSHMVPSGDDGVGSVDEGLVLCREAAHRGTSVLYATPHVWPHLPLTEEREEEIRDAHADMAAQAALFGLDLRLGFELTPAPELLEEDPGRYRLGDLPAVLVDMPFSGPLGLAERFADHIEGSGLVPLLAHPERADGVMADPDLAARYHERGWLLQVNASSLLGRHGPERKQSAWLLLERGLVAVIGSDGHRRARPPFLDEAYESVRRRIGNQATDLFGGSRLPAGDGVDLAQRR